MSSSSKKLKPSGDTGGGPVCIIHFQDSKSDHFTLLTDTNDSENRLQKLQDICRKRLSQPFDSPQRLAHICSQIPTSLSPGLGYHRQCYQRFTSKLDRLIDTDPSSAGTSTGASRSGGKRSSSDRFIFHPDCIFCHSEGRKKVKKASSWTTESLSRFEFGGGESVIKAAEAKQDFDLLRRIKGYDLYACEAQFHPSCRRKYKSDPQHWRSSDANQKLEQENLEASHKAAYEQVCSQVDESLIKRKGIVKLTDLLKRYTEFLQDTPHPSPNYRAEKLKVKLQKSYSRSLSFVSLDKKRKFQSSLVYSTNIDVDALVKMTYDLSCADRVHDVASELRSDIITAFEQSDSLRWPPTAQHLEEMDNVIPEELVKFLCCLLTGHDEVESRKVNRLVRSIGEDLCRAATKGQWKLPKQ